MVHFSVIVKGRLLLFCVLKGQPEKYNPHITSENDLTVEIPSILTSKLLGKCCRDPGGIPNPRVELRNLGVDGRAHLDT